MKTTKINNTNKPLSQIFRGLNEKGSDEFSEEVVLECPTHGSYKGKLFFVANKKIKSSCPVCANEGERKEYEKEQAKLNEFKKQKIAKLVGYAGIPERFARRTFENYRIQHYAQKNAFNIARAYAEQFDDRLAQGGGLIFAGKPGTGKTHLASAIAHHVMTTGRSVLFISALRMLRAIKDSYWHKSSLSEQSIINTFFAPDLLILDEIGIQFGTETEKLILFEVLNGRYEAVLPSIVISNLTESELKHYLGTRVLDRLQEGGGAYVSFDWESYRKQVHLDSQIPRREVSPVKWEE